MIFFLHTFEPIILDSLHHTTIDNFATSDENPKRESDLRNAVLKSDTALTYLSYGCEHEAQEWQAILNDPTFARPERLPNFTLYTIAEGSPTSAPNDEESEENPFQYVKKSSTKASPRSQLRERFFQCAEHKPKYKPAPTLHELETSYADATKLDLFVIATICAAWMCSGARMTISKGRNAVVAEDLTNKWERFNNKDTPLWRPHATWIVETKSIDDIRYMLAAAFFDVELYIRVEDEVPIVQDIVYYPQDAKYWW